MILERLVLKVNRAFKVSKVLKETKVTLVIREIKVIPVNVLLLV